VAAAAVAAAAIAVAAAAVHSGVIYKVIVVGIYLGVRWAQPKRCASAWKPSR